MTSTWMTEDLSRKAFAEELQIYFMTIGKCTIRTCEYIEPNHCTILPTLTLTKRVITRLQVYNVHLNHETNTVDWGINRHGEKIFLNFLESLAPEQRSSIVEVNGSCERWIDECIEPYLPNYACCVDFFLIVSLINNAPYFLSEDAWCEAHHEFKELMKTVKRMRGRGTLMGKDYIVVHNAEAKVAEIKA